MKLTTFTDYSLRVLLYLAAQPERRATIAEIATAFGVSESHLTKVAFFLGKQGWLATVRGRGGGLKLAQPASAVRVGDVVRAAEGEAMPAECFDHDHNTCVLAGSCRLQGVLGEAVRSFNAVLDRYSLADLVRDPGALSKVMFIERPQRAPA